MTTLAPALQAYLTNRLVGQRAASPNTIAAYKLTFRLLLAFAQERIGKAPAALDIADIDAAAVHSLFGYLALHHPEHAASVQRVLAIPPKRTERNLVTYLTEPEVDALLAACDQTMLALTIQTGLRISELTGLTCQDITLSAGANVHTVGKGRKERRTPLVPTTKTVLKGCSPS